MPVTREDLYNEIWAEPMTTVAARYGVSSSFLARVCERLNVPRPPRGHWAKLKVGSASVRPALPDPRPGDERVWVRAGEPPPKVLPEVPRPPETVAKRVRRPVDRAAKHPLVFRSETLFENARVTDEGYLRPRKHIMLDVYVSRPMLAYALDVANQLYQLLEADGHRVTLVSGMRSMTIDPREERTKRDSYTYAWSPSRPTVAFVGTVGFGLTVYETSELVSVEYDWQSKGIKYTRATKPKPTPRWSGAPTEWSKRDMPSGRLAIRAYSPYSVADWTREWREVKPGDLVTRLASIAREIPKAAPELAAKVEEGNRRREEEERKWEAQRLVWQREERERRANEARKQSREDLLHRIEQWAFSTNLESFFRDVERRLETVDDQQRDAIRARVASARALLPSTNALEVFGAWKTPEDRGA